MSADICEQRLSHGNEVVQYSQNYKCYDVDQDHFRKHLKSSTKFMKKNNLKTARTIFKDKSILSYF